MVPRCCHPRNDLCWNGGYLRLMSATCQHSEAQPSDLTTRSRSVSASSPFIELLKCGILGSGRITVIPDIEPKSGVLSGSPTFSRNDEGTNPFCEPYPSAAIGTKYRTVFPRFMAPRLRSEEHTSELQSLRHL